MHRAESFRRLFWSYLIIIIGPIVIVGAVAVSLFFGRLANHAQALNESILLQTQSTIDSFFENAASVAFGISRNEDVQHLIRYSDQLSTDAMDYYYARKELAMQASGNGAIKSVGVFLPRSGTILDSDLNYSVEEYFNQYLHDTAYDLSWWQELFSSGADRAFFAASRNGFERQPDYVVYCQPLRYADRQGGSVFLMVFSFERILERLYPFSDAAAPADRGMALVQENGQPVLSTAGFDATVDMSRLSGSSGSFRDGVDTVIWRGSQMANMKYIYVFHGSNLSGNADWFAGLFLLLLLLCLGISLALARRSFQRLQQPILQVFDENDALTESLRRYVDRERDQTLINLLLHMQKDTEGLQHSMGLTGKKIRLALLGVDNTKWLDTGGLGESGWAQIAEAARTVLDRWDGSYRLVQMSDNLACVLSYDRDDGIDALWPKIIGACEERALTVSVGIDSQDTDMEHLWYAYNNAAVALYCAVRKHPGQAVRLDQIQNDEGEKIFYSVEQEMALMRNIKNGELELTEELLDQIYNTHFRDRYLSPSSLTCLISAMVQLLYKLIDNIFDQDAVENSKYRRVCHNALHNPNAESGFEIVRQCCLALCRRMAGVDRNAMLHRRVSKFVEENYMNRDLSLQDLADYMGLNYYYLSRQFKNIVGDNFTTYLTAFRMEKAKEKLAQKDISIKQVAAEVGFSDSSSFIRAYKKYYHSTPGAS
mgnify:FL=1